MNATYILRLLSAGGIYYIGSSENVMKRYEEHVRYFRAGTHHNKAMQAGWDAEVPAFEFIVMPADTLEEARSMEQTLIRANLDDPLMTNIGLSAVGGDNLTRNPRRGEIIEAIARSIRILVDSMSEEERKARWGRSGEKNGMFGRNHTEESRRKMSENSTGKYAGENSWWYGKHMSDEAKRKLREKALERDIRGERNPFYGKHHSEESKKKQAESMKGRLPANTQAVVINGVTYESATEASRQLGIPLPTVTFRIKSANPKFVGYQLAV